VLTLATGATDAIGFISLGGVFTSVMTGNMVLLGVSAGRGDGALALHTGAAFVGYIAGSWLGARIAGHAVASQPVWPSSISTALVAELTLLAVFGIWWEVAGGHPSGHATYALIAVNAVALGIQSGAVIRFGVNGLSTTYLTGTLTHVVASFTRRQLSVSIRSVAILAALVGGAGLGAVLTVEVPRAAPAVPIGVVIVVLVGASAAFGRFWGASPDQGSGPKAPSEPG
jgi:uncharacterized membrane protein YoaK (UPF0700 family)